MIIKVQYADGTFRMVDNVEEIEVDKTETYDTMAEVLNLAFNSSSCEDYLDCEAGNTTVNRIHAYSSSVSGFSSGSRTKTLVCNSTAYVCNNDGKTLEAIRARDVKNKK